MKFALIKSNIVVNVAEGSQEWADSVSGGYQYVVSIDNLSPEPTIGWGYDGNSFSAPSVSLDQAKATKISEFASAVNDYINLYFPIETRVRFLGMYTLAKFDGLTNRAGYIYPLHAWANSIMGYAATFATGVSSMSTVSDIEAAVWNIPANTNTIPNITVIGAISIPD